MGQHKHNPIAIAAAKGELPPKPVKRSKREIDRKLMDIIKRELYKPFIEAAKKLSEEYEQK